MGGGRSEKGAGRQTALVLTGAGMNDNASRALLAAGSGRPANQFFHLVPPGPSNQNIVSDAFHRVL